MSDDGVLPVHADGRSGEVVVLDTSSLSITDIAPSTSPDVAAVGRAPAMPMAVPVSDVSSHSAPRDTAFAFALSKASESLTVAVLMAVSRALASWFVSHLAQALRSARHFFASLLSLAAAHCRGNSKTVL